MDAQGTENGRPIGPRRTFTAAEAEGATPDGDPVVIYDVMRNAANRLVGVYASQVTVGGIGDPAIPAIRAILDEVHAMDLDDLRAQAELTTGFNRRYAAFGDCPNSQHRTRPDNAATATRKARR